MKSASLPAWRIRHRSYVNLPLGGDAVRYFTKRDAAAKGFMRLFKID